jgi:hypothetical protein
MKTGSIRIPGTPTARKCWIGSYGGHFDVVVVFNKKPAKGKRSEWDKGEISTLRNKDIVAGSFDKDQFNEWFGTDIQPTDTEIRKVEPYMLTSLWDEYGQIIGLSTNYD